MQQKNPWDNDPIVGRAPAGGVPIYGVAPRVKPFEAEDQQIQRNSDVRATDAARIAAEERTYQRGRDRVADARAAAKDAAPPKDPKVTADEKVASGYYRRMVNADNLYGEGVAPRDMASQTAIDMLPAKWENPLSGADRRAATNYADEFIRAKLRKESGAAIPPEERAQEYPVYFPVPGDQPVDLKRKAGLRRVAIEAMGLAAGGEAEKALRGLPTKGVPLSAFNKGMNDIVGDRRKSPQERFAAAIAYADKSNRRVNEEQVKEAIAAGRGNVVEDPKFKPPGMRRGPGGVLEQIGRSVANTGAALAEGLTSLPDMAANAINAAVAIPAEAMGFDKVARDLRTPNPFGSRIREAVPVPQDTVGKGVRFAGQLAGGAASMPMRAQSALAQTFLGKGPPPALPALARPPNRQIMQDARDLNIPMMPSAVAGPTTSALTSFIKQTPGGAQPIVSGARRMVGAADQALRRIAGREGSIAKNAESLGEDATRGGLRYRADSREVIGNMYDAATAASGNMKIVPKRTIEALDNTLADFNQIPMGAKGAEYLTTLRKELVERFPNGVTVSGLRGMKTQMRDLFYKDGLRGSDIERRVNDIVKLASDDMTAGLSQAGKARAADLFRKADAAWATRVETLDDVIMPIIGKKAEKSGEQVTVALNAAAKGNGAKFEKFVKALPGEDAGTVRSSIIYGLGRAKSGAQNAEGDAFSLNTMLTNWDQVGPTARKALFSTSDRGGMDKLARVANRVKESEKFANNSNTGVTVLSGMTAGVGLASIPAAAALVVGQYVSGRILASPGAAAIIAKVVESKGPKAASESVKQLSVLSVRNPALAKDVATLQQRLMESFTQSPATRAAAEEK